MSRRNDESRAERSWLEERPALSQRKGGSRDETERSLGPRAGGTKLQEFFISSRPSYAESATCKRNNAELSRDTPRDYFQDLGTYPAPNSISDRQSSGYTSYPKPMNSPIISPDMEYFSCWQSASSAHSNIGPSKDPEGRVELDEPHRSGSEFRPASDYPSAYRSTGRDSTPQYYQSGRDAISYDSQAVYGVEPNRQGGQREPSSHYSNDWPPGYNSASETPGIILCQPCQGQARRSSKIYLCNACRAKLARSVETCGSSKDDAIKMLSDRLYDGGLLVGGGLLAAHIINHLLRFRPT